MYREPVSRDSNNHEISQNCVKISMRIFWTTEIFIHEISYLWYFAISIALFAKLLIRGIPKWNVGREVRDKF